MDILTEFSVDESSEIGANRIADRLIRYWKGRGYTGITAAAVEAPIKIPLFTWHAGRQQRDRRPVFAVVSNIGPDGFPPRRPNNEIIEIRT